MSASSDFEIPKTPLTPAALRLEVEKARHAYLEATPNSFDRTIKWVRDRDLRHQAWDRKVEP